MITVLDLHTRFLLFNWNSFGRFLLTFNPSMKSNISIFSQINSRLPSNFFVIFSWDMLFYGNGLKEVTYIIRAKEVFTLLYHNVLCIFQCCNIIYKYIFWKKKKTATWLLKLNSIRDKMDKIKTIIYKFQCESSPSLCPDGLL